MLCCWTFYRNEESWIAVYLLLFFRFVAFCCDFCIQAYNLCLLDALNVCMWTALSFFTFIRTIIHSFAFELKTDALGYKLRCLKVQCKYIALRSSYALDHSFAFLSNQNNIWVRFFYQAPIMIRKTFFYEVLPYDKLDTEFLTESYCENGRRKKCEWAPNSTVLTLNFDYLWKKKCAPLAKIFLPFGILGIFRHL